MPPRWIVAAAWFAMSASLLAAEEVDCESKPGGCRCYYDALADGCPQSLGHDSQLLMCSCNYGDNTWLSVLTNFIAAFRGSLAERASHGSRFKVRLEGNGILSMDVGYTNRMQCGVALAGVYPGTNFEVSVEELHSFARNLFWPQVRQKLTDVCVPGRIAMMLFCLHAALATHDGETAQAYAGQIANLFQLVEAHVEGETPWPFPGLRKFLEKWRTVSLPPGGHLDPGTSVELAWWPERELMRGKTPEESASHYWPCAPLKDPSCFPVGTEFVAESCENCCDPGKGAQGDSQCWAYPFTFERCCRTPNDQGRFY